MKNKQILILAIILLSPQHINQTTADSGDDYLLEFNTAHTEIYSSTSNDYKMQSGQLGIEVSGESNDYIMGGYYPISECGNGAVEYGEQCDGNNLNEISCQNYGFDSGSLICNNCQIKINDCYNQPNTTANGQTAKGASVERLPTNEPGTKTSEIPEINTEEDDQISPKDNLEFGEIINSIITELSLKETINDTQMIPEEKLEIIQDTTDYSDSTPYIVGENSKSILLKLKDIIIITNEHQAPNSNYEYHLNAFEIDEVINSSDDTPLIAGKLQKEKEYKVIIKDQKNELIYNKKILTNNEGSFAFSPESPLPKGQYTISLQEENQSQNDERRYNMNIESNQNINENDFEVISFGDTENLDQDFIQSQYLGTFSVDRNIPIIGKGKPDSHIYTYIDDGQYIIVAKSGPNGKFAINMPTLNPGVHKIDLIQEAHTKDSNLKKLNHNLRFTFEVTDQIIEKNRIMEQKDDLYNYWKIIPFSLILIFISIFTVKQRKTIYKNAKSN